MADGVDDDYTTYTWQQLVALQLTDEKRKHFHMVRTISREFAVPKVLVLKEFDGRPPQTVKFSRGQVFQRDRHICQYCAKTFPKQRLNLDHVVPRAHGGKTTWDNVVTSCIHCNWKKGSRTPSQAGMRLLNVPKRPQFSPNLHLLTAAHPTWEHFLFVRS